MLLNEFMNSRQELAEKTMKLIKEKELTIDHVARKIGIRGRTLYSFLNGAKVSIVTLIKVEKFLEKQ